jgi:hypothetical protein
MAAAVAADRMVAVDLVFAAPPVAIMENAAGSFYCFLVVYGVPLVPAHASDRRKKEKA